MVTDTWSSRDEPVLEAIVELIDEGATHVSTADLVKQTGFDLETVQRSLVALAAEDPPFFEYSDVTTMGSKIREIDFIRSPSGHARRTVKAWPTPEDMADRIVAALEQAAENAPDEEQAGRLRRAGQSVRGVGRDVLVNVIATALGGG